ncbi:hypothetical protein ACROYT_G015848 [Oculina patagonica]
MERGSHLLLFLLFLEMTNTEAFADEDGSQRSRSAYVVTKPNKQSNGHVVKRFVSPSLLSCSHLCMRNKWCTSTNFNLFSKNNSKGTCELLNAFSFMDGTQFHEEKGATFAMLLKDPCQTNPCQNNGDCVPYFASNTYHCSCKAGFAGAHCEEGSFSCPSAVAGLYADPNDCSKYIKCHYGPMPNQPVPKHWRLRSRLCKQYIPLCLICKAGLAGRHCEEGTFSCPSDGAGLYADPSD